MQGIPRPSGCDRDYLAHVFWVKTGSPSLHLFPHFAQPTVAGLFSQLLVGKILQQRVGVLELWKQFGRQHLLS